MAPVGKPTLWHCARVCASRYAYAKLLTLSACKLTTNKSICSKGLLSMFTMTLHNEDKLAESRGFILGIGTDFVTVTMCGLGLEFFSD